MARVSRNPSQQPEQQQQRPNATTASRPPRAPRNNHRTPSDQTPSRVTARDRQMWDPSSRARMSGVFPQHPAVSAAHARQINASIPGHPSIASARGRLDSAPDMRNGSQLRMSSGGYRHARRPRPPANTNTLLPNPSNSEQVQDSASEGSPRPSLLRRFGNACQLQFSQVPGLSKENNRFKTDLKKLSNDLQQHRLTQPTQSYNSRLRTLQKRKRTK